MTKEEIFKLRSALGLTQAQFGQLFGAHPITVGRWESGEYQPNAHQLMLLENFQKSARDKEVREGLEQVLIGVGVAAALYLLLKAATKGK